MMGTLRDTMEQAANAEKRRDLLAELRRGPITLTDANRIIHSKRTREAVIDALIDEGTVKVLRTPTAGRPRIELVLVDAPTA